MLLISFFESKDAIVSSVSYFWGWVDYNKSVIDTTVSDLSGRVDANKSTIDTTG